MTVERQNDEIVLIDFLLERCEDDVGAEVRRRLEHDGDFRRLHDDIANTLKAMAVLSQMAPPEDLVAKTLDRLRQHKQTDALLAREQTTRRAAGPTFSIRELGAVAASILLMALIFVPSIQKARNLTEVSRCASNVGQIGVAVGAYANGNGDCLPGVYSDRGRWLATARERATSNSSGLFKLIRGEHVGPRVFQCPEVGGGSFAVQAGMTDFPSHEYVNYSYQHTLRPEPLLRSNPLLIGYAERMAILADSTPVFVRGRQDRLEATGSDNHDGKGQNVLFLDSHVDWAEGPEVGVGYNNIYLIDGVKDYRGDEAPAKPMDSFLLPTHSGR